EHSLSFARGPIQDRAGHVSGPAGGPQAFGQPQRHAPGVGDEHRCVTSAPPSAAAVGTRSGCVAVEGKWVAHRAVLRVQRALGQASRDGRLLELEATAGSESGENVVRSYRRCVMSYNHRQYRTRTLERVAR